MDAKIFGSKLKELRLQKGYSLRQAALQTQTPSQKPLSPSFWSRVENGERDVPKITTLKRMAHGLRISEDEIMELAGYDLHSTSNIKNMIPLEKAEVVQFPILGTIKCGSNGIAYEDFQGYEKVERKDIAKGYEYFWLVTSGDSMIGDGIKDGDYALIKKTSEFNNGDICAVIVDGEEGMLKHITKKNGTVILTSSNPEYPARVLTEDVVVVGKLVEIKRRY